MRQQLQCNRHHLPQLPAAATAAVAAGGGSAVEGADVKEAREV